MMTRPFETTRLLWFCLFLAAGPSAASALYDASADSADRFPFVVEIKHQSRLICSGTVLYPRIVVTAAHCLQEKVNWGGMQFYTDAYVAPVTLSVSVLREGRTQAYEVVETAISPHWRTLIQENSIRRFPYDLALVITKEPIEVEAPPSALEEWVQRGVGAIPYRGMLVAFGGEHCVSTSQCDDAGVRRFMHVVIKETSHCFRRQGERDLLTSLSVWCLDSGVMPGDSGGALLIEDDDGQLRYVGVISAQQGLPPELAAAASWRRSLAAGLSTNLPFIVEKARELGYER